MIKRALLRPALVAVVALQLIAGISSAQIEGSPDAEVRSPAEFGRASGPSLELLTKSQQKWSGSLGLTLSKSSNPFSSNSARGYGATLGGTVIQDRLWFFGSAHQTSGFDFRQFAPATPHSDASAAKAFAARLDSQLGARQSLSASLAQFRSSSPLLVPPSSTPLPASSLSLRYTAAVSNNMFFTANVSQRSTKGSATSPVPGF